jgi:beta-glucosidase
MHKTFLFSIISVILLSSCAISGKSNKEAILDQKADSVLRLMTLDEKIGQMVLYSSDWDVTGPSLKKLW